MGSPPSSVGRGEGAFTLIQGVAVGELWVEVGAGAEAKGVDGVVDRKGRVEGHLGDLMERETEGVRGIKRQQKDTCGMCSSDPDFDDGPQRSGHKEPFRQKRSSRRMVL